MGLVLKDQRRALTFKLGSDLNFLKVIIEYRQNARYS